MYVPLHLCVFLFIKRPRLDSHVIHNNSITTILPKYTCFCSSGLNTHKQAFIHFRYFNTYKFIQATWSLWVFGFKIKIMIELLSHYCDNIKQKALMNFRVSKHLSRTQTQHFNPNCIPPDDKVITRVYTNLIIRPIKPTFSNKLNAFVESNGSSTALVE